jgi:predicted negative regulator of RcsB-dependent stress response
VREHLGDVYLKLGRIDEARKQWQQALELTTDKEEVGRLKDKLRDNQANSTKP